MIIPMTDTHVKYSYQKLVVQYTLAKVMLINTKFTKLDKLNVMKNGQRMFVLYWWTLSVKEPTLGLFCESCVFWGYM